jgi:hypothetical protein
LSNARADNVHQLAFRVDKSFTFGTYKVTGKVTGIFDLFNVFNTNAVTNFNLVNGKNYNLINATVDPRTAQIAVRVTF